VQQELAVLTFLLADGQTLIFPPHFHVASANSCREILASSFVFAEWRVFPFLHAL
jgi:hypothetical protein